MINNHMALQIGSGITIGGGITFQPEAAPANVVFTKGVNYLNSDTLMYMGPIQWGPSTTLLTSYVGKTVNFELSGGTYYATISSGGTLTSPTNIPVFTNQTPLTVTVIM